MAYEDVNKETRNTACSPTVVVNGGTVNVADSVMMSESFATNSLAKSADTISTFTVNAGVVTVQTNFYAVYREGKSNRAPRGVVNLNGGELDIKGTLNLCRNSKTTGTVWLNEGGLLKAGEIIATRAGGSLHFNGGVFMPYGVLPNGTPKATMNGTTASNDGEIDFLVSEGGAVVDTSIVAGGIYTIAAALKHDPGIAGTDGGLVKKGAGTLALSGANTFTGPVVVEEGTLQALSDTALPTVTEVRYGTTLDLGGASRTVGGIAGDGVVQNGTLVLSGRFPQGKAFRSSTATLRRPEARRSTLAAQRRIQCRSARRSSSRRSQMERPPTICGSKLSTRGATVAVFASRLPAATSM